MLSSTWTLEDFQTAISKDVHSPPVSNVNLKVSILLSVVDYSLFPVSVKGMFFLFY